MEPTPRNLVVVITHGTDHELSSAGFTIASGGMTAGLKVSIFLTSSGVDLVRKRAIDTTHVPPLDPLRDLVQVSSELGDPAAKIGSVAPSFVHTKLSRDQVHLERNAGPGRRHRRANSIFEPREVEPGEGRVDALVDAIRARPEPTADPNLAGAVLGAGCFVQLHHRSR